MSLNVSKIRRHFPILSRAVNGRPLVYFDSAATAQVPEPVLTVMEEWNKQQRANVHRGMHQLAEESTVAYEEARVAVQRFLGAKHSEEIIFTKSCTEAINLVARSWGDANIHRGDAVVLSILEHHSNTVPWLQIKERTDCDVLWVDMDDRGRLREQQLLEHLATGRVKLVAVTAQSNMLGVRPDLPAIIRHAHAAGALVLVDAAQAVAHMPIAVEELDCDFLAFSGHKLYGPTGIGVLYGKRAILESMPPFLGGGMMIRDVRMDGFTPGEIPAKFEAGTPPIAEAVGLRAAIEWLSRFDGKDVQVHEEHLLQLATSNLQEIDDLVILPTKNKRMTERMNDLHGCLSFTIGGIHPHDLTEILGRQGICLRAGHHCCMPLHRRLGISASTRLSVAIYNTAEEITQCADAIVEAQSRLLTRKARSSHP